MHKSVGGQTRGGGARRAVVFESPAAWCALQRDCGAACATKLSTHTVDMGKYPTYSNSMATDTFQQSAAIYVISHARWHTKNEGKGIMLLKSRKFSKTELRDTVVPRT